MKNKPIIYLDSCCFIDVVKESAGALPKDREDDVWHIKKLMEAHRQGDLRLITSTLTVGECVAIAPGQTDVPAIVQDHFRRLITNGQYVVLAQQTPKTGELVQDLRWKHKVVLAGADGLHMATALEYQAKEFITTDEKLKKPKMVAAATQLGAIGINLTRAANTLLLPDKFKQGDMLHA